MSNPERRSRERFPYTSESCPLLVIDERAYEIIDLGERGLRARCGDPERWLLGSIVEGTVWLQRDSKVRVEGIVVRAGAGELVLRLSREGIPARALLGELRYAQRPES
ncbi:MAG TPA: hypothetical protein VFW66_04350 [Gemmatimonadales bacterium]|nr:hypothetical protein [Gemmatimonadales bacterium]